MNLKSFLLIIVVVTINFNKSLAQNYPRKFGDISDQELKMTKYAPDTSAIALVVYDKGLSKFCYVTNDFEIHFTETKRIKILKNAGKEYAQISIPYYHQGDIYEKITDLEAYTYNLENGERIKTALDPSQVFDEKEGAFWSDKKFAFPNVKAGSVIEYRYTLITPYKFMLHKGPFRMTFLPCTVNIRFI